MEWNVGLNLLINLEVIDILMIKKVRIIRLIIHVSFVFVFLSFLHYHEHQFILVLLNRKVDVVNVVYKCFLLKLFHNLGFDFTLGR